MREHSVQHLSIHQLLASCSMILLHSCIRTVVRPLLDIYIYPNKNLYIIDILYTAVFYKAYSIPAEIELSLIQNLRGDGSNDTCLLTVVGMQV